MDMLPIVILSIIWWLIGAIALLIYIGKKDKQITISNIIISIFFGGGGIIILFMILFGVVFVHLEEMFDNKVIWKKK